MPKPEPKKPVPEAKLTPKVPLVPKQAEPKKPAPVLEPKLTSKDYVTCAKSPQTRIISEPARKRKAEETNRHTAVPLRKPSPSTDKPADLSQALVPFAALDKVPDKAATFESQIAIRNISQRILDKQAWTEAKAAPSASISPSSGGKEHSFDLAASRRLINRHLNRVGKKSEPKFVLWKIYEGVTLGWLADTLAAVQKSSSHLDSWRKELDSPQTADYWAIEHQPRILSRSSILRQCSKIGQTIQGEAKDLPYGLSITGLLRSDLLPAGDFHTLEADLARIATQFTRSHLTPEVKLAKVLETVRAYCEAKRADTRFTIEEKLQALIRPLLYDLAQIQAAVSAAESIGP